MIAELEEIRTPKPERFPSGDDQDAWHVASQMLGDLYMEINRPDLAIPCYQDFRASHRSGARTLFKIAQAHEQLGDIPRAIKFYKTVTGYDGNPLVSDAQEGCTGWEADRSSVLAAWGRRAAERKLAGAEAGPYRRADAAPLAGRKRLNSSSRHDAPLRLLRHIPSLCSSSAWKSRLKRQ